ncbi:Blue copper protein [Melia azedarach]|uniref:Blue copper protein n=1 Tax=Melia azedarach TaxID=155640 RepID=A0ACC1XQ86_MELAZ|nr:Blue copper protein [Melia azedarach]
MELIMMPRWAVKAILLTVLVSIPLRCASATNHSVGGPTGWDLSSNVQAWSATNTFHVGDTLVFTYTPAHSVLEVNQLEYTTCGTINPISVHSSGDTVLHLTQPGTRYFICGREGHCAMGLKFRVDVLPQLAANETRRGGGGGGGRRPPRPPRHSPPPPTIPDSSPPPSTPDFPEPTPEAPPPPPSPEPCGNSAVGGMIRFHFLDSWWVPLLTILLVFAITSRLLRI